MIPKGNIFCIIGLGLMGGCYAMGLSKQGYRVTALNRSGGSLEWARNAGIIAEGALTALNRPTEESFRLLGEADTVIIALYPDDILAWLRTHRAHLKKGALVSDLAGVKGCFVPEAQALLAPDFEFIPCHPMAGREVSGVQNANDAIFRGANFLITPTEQNTPQSIAFARDLAGLLGFARVTELSVEEHDRLIGYVSQLTHAIAVSLMNANSDPRLPEVTGDSFRDLTRIADINAELWSELFLANAGALTEEIDIFTGCLQELRVCLAKGDKAGLVELFETSGRRRREFRRKEPSA